MLLGPARFGLVAACWHQTKTVVSMAGDHWYLDSEAAGYNQHSWMSTYNFNAREVTKGNWSSDSGGSWFVPLGPPSTPLFSLSLVTPL